MAKTPDYAVLASTGIDGADRLVQVGVAFDSESRAGNPYIQVLLSARPWGEWDGKLQLHRIERREDRAGLTKLAPAYPDDDDEVPF